MSSGKRKFVLNSWKYQRTTKMFAVNHSKKHIYKLAHEMESYEEMLEENPLWLYFDDIDFIEYDMENNVGRFMFMGYSSNLPSNELPNYLVDPDNLVWYMDLQGFSPQDICRAIQVWDGTEKKRMAEETLEEMLDSRGIRPEVCEDEDMLCHAMNRTL